MLNSFLIAFLVSALLAFAAGLGVGGGTLLTLWLTIVLRFPQNLARTINLLFFLPAAFIASLFRWKQGTLKLSRVFPAILAGCISAAIFSVATNHINTEVTKKVFGLLLLFAGSKELLSSSQT